jgi:hypothetical protein
VIRGALLNGFHAGAVTCELTQEAIEPVKLGDTLSETGHIGADRICVRRRECGDMMVVSPWNAGTGRIPGKTVENVRETERIAAQKTPYAT